MFLVSRRSLHRVARPLAMLSGSAAFLATAAGLPTQASAQSFFEQIFGLGPKPASRPAAISMPLPAQRFYSPSPPRAQDGTEERGTSEHRGGSYRTVCVRLCDGAFFPISYSAQRSHMYGDADVCRNRCWGTEARLFYHHHSADMKEAVDLAGRSYKALPTAFLFRKKLVDGCACKPAPWNEAELDRHRRYAIAAGRVPPAQAPGGDGTGGVVVIAGNYPSPPAPAPQREAREEAVEPTEIDGIPVVNVPVAAPPIPQMAQADFEATPGLGGRSWRWDPVEARYEARSQADPKSEPRQAATPRTQQAPGWKVVKPAAASPFAAPSQHPRRAAPAPSTATLFGSPGGKYVWPGDAPTRYR